MLQNRPKYTGLATEKLKQNYKKRAAIAPTKMADLAYNWPESGCLRLTSTASIGLQSPQQNWPIQIGPTPGAGFARTGPYESQLTACKK